MSPGFTFVDLFAGIGGMRLAFERAGGECVFSAEWDPYACKTYEANFADVPAGDITDIKAASIPDHDILLAGFPCQPFSIAGVSKHNALGNEHGFRHRTQGTLFYDVARIIDEKRPAAFLLENVKNLLSHDRKRTFQEIMRSLRDDIGYNTTHEVIDGALRVPQHRERVFIAGFRDSTAFEFPDIAPCRRELQEILEDNPGEKYILTDGLWEYLQEYAEKHRQRGNGFGYGLVDPAVKGVVTRTLSARYYKDGSEILINRGEDEPPRRLTPRECARLMGFPEEFDFPVSDTRAYKQIGNSVVVPIVEEIALEMVRCLRDENRLPIRPDGQIRMLIEESAEYAAGS